MGLTCWERKGRGVQGQRLEQATEGHTESGDTSEVKPPSVRIWARRGVTSAGDAGPPGAQDSRVGEWALPPRVFPDTHT